MAKKVVLKIIITCSKCQTCIMKTIASISGISSIAIDVEKSTVTVVGEVDVVVIVCALRKAKKAVEIVSVGAPKVEPEAPDKCKNLPACCNSCRPVVIWQQESAACNIM